MYYIVYGIFYLISLLPWFIIYALSDFIYFVLYYIIKYRRGVVMSNLKIAFPGKSEKELTAISKESYHGLVDTFIEVIKLLTLSKKKLLEMCPITGVEALEPYIKTNRNIQIIAGHFYSWEMANPILGVSFPMPTLGVYMPLSNKVMDKIMYKIRARFGTKLISSKNFTKEYLHYTHQANVLLLAADQKPGKVERGKWMYFFSQPAPFIPGPAKGAHKFNAAVFYCDYYREKRGKYRFKLELITDDPKSIGEDELTRIFRNKIEASIRRHPGSYLWTHKRWKHQWKPEYANLWIDTVPAPPFNNH
ncbi:lysophospholipid acyltransferase family protein [Polluticaenibacter yanchengensis]|uniref:Lipid A biosynthesis acyltransferase n=1 Tax=Polluticaenibacter yanchengensis TaxID=3014562 RepID=A0ABT4UQY0_9BACT|nr:lipid A biosynthesis acyltransferase [Chitinophagaceae bacterium LY-5]